MPAVNEVPRIEAVDAFERLLNDERFASIPGYLELPPEENLATLEVMRAWRQAGKPFEVKGESPKPTNSRVARKPRGG